jgi:hypothetical protein
MDAAMNLPPPRGGRVHQNRNTRGLAPFPFPGGGNRAFHIVLRIFLEELRWRDYRKAGCWDYYLLIQKSQERETQMDGDKD